MRKAFTILAALVLTASFCFAQVNTNQMAKRVNRSTVQKTENAQFDARTHSVVKHLLQTSGVTKYDNDLRNAQSRATGNPVWDQTMSYCLDAAFASSVGLGSPGDVYWGIKIESAALVGRNTLTDVQLFVAYAGSYTLNIYSGADPTGTAIATQTITATDADTMSWKNIHFTTPVAITQSQDLWVTFHCSTLAYPATGVSGNEYDNGKYISLDGATWNLVTSYGLDYTWMIKAISDTYVELPPQLTLDGPSYVLNGDTATYTVSSPNANSYSWNITADYTTNSGTTAQAMWLTDGVKQVIASATNNAGTTTDTLDVTVISCDAINTFPFAEGFENDILCWTMVSMDPANDDRFGIYADASAYEGNYDFRFSSFHTASDYNQYLITPEITLPATGNYMVKFKYHGYNSNDAFRVMTSTTTNAISSFTQLADYPTVTTSAWDEVALVLPAGTKYVAINYYGNYMYYLYVDAFSIEALSAPVATLAGPSEIEVGTPATFNVTTSPAADTYAWSVDGAAVASTTETLTHTFTTAGNHTVQVITSNSIGSDTASMVVEAYVCETITTFPFVEDFETGTLRCWTMISNDPANDAYFGVQEDGSYAYEGDYDFWFSSYSSASDYNQYLITPELQVPTTGTYMVKFYYQGGSTAESFKVLTSSTTNALSSFTELLDVPTTSTDWTEVAALLPAGTKYVAINYYADYMYFLYVDNFSVELLGAPSVTISGPTSVPSGSSATFTATAPLATSFAWTVDGTAVSSTTNTMTTTFATGGNHTVAVTASNSEGSNTASMTVNVISCDAITSYPFVENFENAEAFDCWTFIDDDGDGFNWDINYLRDAENDEGTGYGHNGSYGLVGSASWNSSAGALTPDNWMITPAFAIPSNGTYKLNWYVKGQDPDYAGEYYSVYAATQNSLEAFKATTPLFNGFSTDEWTLKTVNLSAYAGQTIYIAFRHHNVTDMFYIDIDDISVAQGTGLEEHDMNIAVYPNPAMNNINVVGEGIQLVEIMDINGRTLMTFNEGGQLSIASLANGMYLVRVVTENGVQMNKIVKK